MSEPRDVLILVNYRVIENLHVFTSPDVYGLYVADEDPQAAYERVGPSLVHLLKMNEGVDGEIEPLLTYAEFTEGARDDEDDEAAAIPPAAVIEEIRNFRFRPAAA